ncbi:hypothetical protein B0J12DRAFT_645720 [Macrophomina phaseolina]|uniref:Secreted protein n=1 Tax=Macrophomina phaseolina TaxID=35725 RepID=A0ABQ8GQS6_9PEZI|nr:hypothetical protein B0J12DRAFT_645720 [Macrophomina phaseolina]
MAVLPGRFLLACAPTVAAAVKCFVSAGWRCGRPRGVVAAWVRRARRVLVCALSGCRVVRGVGKSWWLRVGGCVQPVVRRLVAGGGFWWSNEQPGEQKGKHAHRQALQWCGKAAVKQKSGGDEWRRGRQERNTMGMGVVVGVEGESITDRGGG